MTAQFEVYRERRTPARVVRPRRWRWRLRAANGEVVGSGQAFTRKHDAIAGTEDLVAAARVAVTKPIEVIE